MTKCMIIELKTTPLQNQWQPCHPHQIPDRLMYQTGAEMGEKTSIGQQVTASLQTQELTMSCKNRIYAAPKLLPSSASNAASIDV
jgi:hypothetical protein